MTAPASRSFHRVTITLQYFEQFIEAQIIPSVKILASNFSHEDNPITSSRIYHDTIFGVKHKLKGGNPNGYQRKEAPAYGPESS